MPTAKNAKPSGGMDLGDDEYGDDYGDYGMEDDEGTAEAEGKAGNSTEKTDEDLLLEKLRPAEQLNLEEVAGTLLKRTDPKLIAYVIEHHADHLKPNIQEALRDFMS